MKARHIRIFRGFDNLPHFVHPAVTVGSFDGVHLGHKALIDRLTAEAHAHGGESIVVTFDPHPRITLGRAAGLQLLTPLDEKIALLERLASIMSSSFRSTRHSAPCPAGSLSCTT